MSKRRYPKTPRASSARECTPRQRAAIEAHVARHLAPATHVFHEIRSEIVHLDLHVVPPATEHPFWFVFTTGMSALAMNGPHSRHAELSWMLPDHWQMDRRRWAREPQWFWPIRELFDLARYPHRHRTWLGAGHTIGSHPPRTYDASTRFGAMLILPCSIADHPIQGDVETELLALFPLHADELAYKQARGLFPLLDQMDRAGVDLVLDLERPSVITCAAAGQGTVSP